MFFVLDKKGSQLLMAFLSGLVFFSLALVAYAQPSQSPPDGNTLPPINVSTSSQIKNGSLGIGGSASIAAGLKLGFTSATCDAVTEGSIIYESGTLKICSDTEALTQGTSSEYWTAVGSDIYFDLGDVAIGTDTPAPGLRLTVSGLLGADQICDSNGSNCVFQSDIGRSEWTKSVADVYYTLGNVGVGTETPTNPLSVHVNTAGDSVPLLVRNDNGGNYAVGIELANGTARSVIESERVAGGSGADTVINSTNAAGALTEYVRVTQTGDVGIGDATPDSSLKLDVEGQIGATEYCDSLGANCITAANLASEVWTETGSDIYFLGGDVGIGVTNPQQNLHTNLNIRVDGGHVFGSGGQDLYLGAGSGGLYFDSDSVSNSWFALRDSENDFFGSFYGTDGDYIGILDGDSNWAIQHYKDTHTDFRINNTTAFYLESGAAAVGTSTIDSGLALDVAGSVGAVEFCDENGANCTSADSLGGGLWTENGSDIYYNSGNVGIGLSSPGSRRLTVNGGTSITWPLRSLNQYGYIDFGPANSSGAHIYTNLDRFYLNKKLSILTNDITSYNNDFALQRNEVSKLILTTSGAQLPTGHHLYFGSQDLYGDDGNSLYFDSNNSASSRLVLRDSQNDEFGSFYGQDGDYIGLLDGDGNWALQHQKDVQTNWRINNAEQMRLTTTGLGIGETSPAAGLHLANDGGRLRIEQDTAGGTFNGLDFYAYTGARNGGLIWNQSTGEVRLDAAASYFPTIYSNGNEVVRIDTTGDVGIGDTTPDGTLKLDVEGQVGATEYCDENGANCFASNDVSGGVWMDADDREFSYDGTSHYYWLKVANLATNGGKVNFTFLIKDDVNYPRFAEFRLDASSWNNTSVSLAVDRIAGDLGKTLEAKIDTNRDVWVRTNIAWDRSFTYKVNNVENATVYQDNVDRTESDPANSSITVAENVGYRFLLSDLSTPTHTEISDIYIDVSGNVGIGTGNTPPTQRLEVYGNIDVSNGRHIYLGNQDLYGDDGTALYFDSNNANASQIILRDSDDDQFGTLYGSQGDYFGLLDGDGNWALQHQKDVQTNWRINNVEQMRLTTTGLNINTTLNVAGSRIDIDTGDDNSGATVDFRGSNTGKNFRIGNQQNIGNAFEITPSTTNGGDTYTNPAVVVTGDSDVGIGDTTPDGTLKLDVEGQVGATEYCDQNGANCFTPGSAGSVWNTTGSDIYYNSGNVGIGTNSPSGQLEVSNVSAGGHGNITITGSGAGYINAGLVLQATDSTHYRGLGVFMHDAGGDTEWFTGTPYAASDQYQIGRRSGIASHDTSSAQQTYAFLTVKNDGDVGIGTTAPSGTLKLDVEGQVGGTAFCDQNGANCFAATDVTGGSGGSTGGSGTINTIAKWTGLTSLGDSTITDNAGLVSTTGNLRAQTGHLYLGAAGAQDLYGDNGQALYFDSNHSNNTRLILRDAENTVYGELYGSADGANFGLLDGDGDWAFHHAKDSYSTWRINGSEQMRLTTTGLGLGITNPSSKLVVQGGENEWTAQFNNTNTNTYGVLINAGDSSANRALQVQDSGGSPLFMVRGDGDVAVGTFSPSGTLKLDVEGQIGATAYCDENGANCQSITALGGGDDLGNHTATQDILTYNYGTGVTGNYSATRYQHVWGMGAAYNLPDNGLDETGPAGNFYGLAWAYNPNYSYAGSNPQAKAGLNHQMLLMMNGLTYTALGNGIWTQGDLTFDGAQHIYFGSQDLYGDNANYLYFDSNNASASGFILRDSDNDLYGSFYGSQGDNIGILDGDLNWAVLHQKDSNTQWRINNAEQMRLTTTGLGIGLTPEASLHTSGNFLLQNAGEIRSKDTGGSQRTIARVNTSNELEYGWSGAGPVKFMGGGSYTERMRIHTNGNVGIGATSFLAPLTVSGTFDVNGGVIAVNGTGVTGGVSFYDNGSARGALAYGNDGNIFSGALTDSLSLRSEGALHLGGSGNNMSMTMVDGEVGIGTNSPDSDLHLHLDTGVDAAGGGAGIKFTLADDAGPGWNMRIGDTADDGSFNIDSQQGAGWLNRFTINRSTGDVGIGDSIPDGTLKLDVEGQIGATEYCDQNGSNCVAAGSLGGSDNLGNHTATAMLNMNGNDIDFVTGNTGQIRSLGTMSFDWTGGTYDGSQWHGIESKNEAGSFADALRINSYADIVNTIDSNANSNSRFVIQKESAGDGVDLYVIDEAGNSTTYGSITATGRHLYLGAHDLYADNDSALYYDSNSSNYTQMVFRDLENTAYGYIYGAGNGSSFGLLDGDGNWAVHLVKDSATEFRINNNIEMELTSTGLGIGMGGTNPSYTLDVQGNARITSAITTASNIYIEQASPTIYLRDNDHYSGMIHQNSNLFYVLSGSGVNSTSWTQNANSRWPMYIDMTNNNAVFGGDINAISFTQASDRKLKDNIKTLSGLDIILGLRGVEFTWKESGQQSMGLIAQEVEQVAPELVTETKITDPETGEVVRTDKAVQYANLVAPLIEATKEQQALIEQQQNTIDQLLERIEALEQK